MGCHTICDLPDSLLTQILLNLPTKDSVKTSVLSTRWRNLWLSVPGLDIATYEFDFGEIFERFMDRFMEFNHGSRLQNFRIWHQIMYGTIHNLTLMELIGKVVDRGLQHLDVTLNFCVRDGFRNDFMLHNIYKSKTLVSLKLAVVVLKKPEFVASLPCLKILHLRSVCYDYDGPLIVEKLISGCPVLEDLELIRPFHIYDEKNVMFLRVSSQTLKICSLRFVNNRGVADFTVEIDAPRLEFLSLSESDFDRIVVKNLNSLLMVNIGTKYSFDYGSPLQPQDLRKRDLFYDFLTGISSVRHMILCQFTLEVLYSYSKVEPIPKLHNLYHLQLEFFSSSLQLELSFLESCPNLKILSLLGSYDSKELWKIDCTNVPRCLISTLEYVEIKEWKMKDETGIIKFVNYFLENSAVLKKLTLSFKNLSITKQELESYKKLLTPTKLSPTCEVIID
ncbi:F-box/FBD/LRR-repeat protein [Cardamine amara subsp. amara]|uniref:F-box/FBD/LRR-repeat protein n=1 Tax=Cardamine amara subsp. amara TaxID=228776 RepID=A0ABD1C3C3_CARAN